MFVFKQKYLIAIMVVISAAAFLIILYFLFYIFLFDKRLNELPALAFRLAGISTSGVGAFIGAVKLIVSPRFTNTELADKKSLYEGKLTVNQEAGVWAFAFLGMGFFMQLYSLLI